MGTYLDHASSSPLRPAARQVMLRWIDEPGDPGRLHTPGRTTRVGLEEAREQVAAFFGARPREVVFTSGGTEAVNAAIWGAATRAGDGRGDVAGRTTGGTGPRKTDAVHPAAAHSPGAGGEPHLVASAVEHSAVLEAAQRSGRVTLVGVDRFGRFDPEDILAALRPETALVSVQLANHEVGTVQPAAEVAARCRERGVLVHVDACAAAGHLPVDFAALGADLCSVTAHKLGGPRGIGALLVRRGLRLPPLIVGGAAERARRAGLENVAAAAGFAAAVAGLDLDTESHSARALTDRILTEVPGSLDGITVFGDPTNRLPHLICLGVDGVEAEPVLLGLDQRGVAVHSGSSCSSETFEPSPVLAAMGADADHSLRVSVGWSSGAADVDTFLDAFAAVVTQLRALR